MSHRYSTLKVFHFPEKLASLPREISEIRGPLHVRVKPTNLCPHRCRYCAYRAPDLQLGGDMTRGASIPRAKMLEILEDFVTLNVRAVTFSGGGEPLHYPYLEEATEFLASSSIQFAALTNGARLSGRLAELFARHGAWVRISIDGWDAESYSRYRGVGLGEYGRVVANMQSFKELGGRCRLGVSVVVDADNADHVREILAVARRVGADSAKVSPCVISDDGETNSRYHEPFFERVHRQIEQARAENRGTEFEIHNAYGPQETVFDKPYSWCPYLQVLPVIGADLNVYTCQDKAYNLQTGLLGSIETIRFRDFWMSGKDKFFRVNPSRDCRHHCVADRKNRLVLEYLETDPDHLGFV